MNKRETPEETLEWSALEYEYKERSNDWFWTLGIIVATGAVTAIIYSNYFFAALLIIGGGLLGFFAKAHPPMMYYQLSSKGLRIGNRLYPFENIKAFWVQADLVNFDQKPLLFIKSGRILVPIISVPIENAWADKIHQLFMSKSIPEVEMHEHASEKIMESLGF